MTTINFTIRLKNQHKMLFGVFFMPILICYSSLMNAQVGPPSDWQLAGTTVFGKATYTSIDEGNAIKPIRKAKILIGMLTSGNIRYDLTTYTDSEGKFSASLSGVKCDRAEARLYFENELVSVRTFETRRSDVSQGIAFSSTSNAVAFELNFSYAQNSDFNKTAIIFMRGLLSAEFAKSRGVTPPQAIIRYPLEEGLVDNINSLCIDPLPIATFFGANFLSFYWPFPDLDISNLRLVRFINYMLPLISMPLNFLESFRCRIVFKENSIYLTKNTAETPRGKSTVFHEYGHFLMRHLRGGTWPVATYSDYEFPLGEGSEPFEHSLDTYDMTSKQGYIEGWANFFASAVESFYYPINSNFFSGSYVGTPDIMEFPNYYNSSVFSFSNVGDGYRNEITVGATLFDFYDPKISGDNDMFQENFNNICSHVGSLPNTTHDYCNILFSNSTDIRDKRAIFGIMRSNKLGENTLSVSSSVLTGSRFEIAKSEITVERSEGFFVEANASLSLLSPRVVFKSPFHAKPNSNIFVITSNTGSQSIEDLTRDNDGAISPITKSFQRHKEGNDSLNQRPYASEMSLTKKVSSPTAFALFQNYPNPFNPTTTIRYALPRSAKVVLAVYDVLGRKAMELVNETKGAGFYEVSLNASRLSSGTYFYRLQAGEYVETRKMALVK